MTTVCVAIYRQAVNERLRASLSAALNGADEDRATAAHQLDVAVSDAKAARFALEKAEQALAASRRECASLVASSSSATEQVCAFVTFLLFIYPLTAV